MFKKALELKGDDTDCFLELAQLLEFRKPEESLKLYEQLLQVVKNKKSAQEENVFSHNLYNINEIMPEILNNIATIKIRLNLFSDLDKLLHESLSLVRINKEKHQKDRLIQEENKKSSFDEALLRFTALEQSIFFNFALYHESKCEFDAAYKYYKMLIKENPYFIEAYVKLGEMAKMRGNKAKAMEYMRLAVEKSFHKVKENEKGTENSIDTGKRNDGNINNVSQMSGVSNSVSNLSNNLNPNLNHGVASLFPSSKNTRVISVLNKPINPCLILAQIYSESGNEQEALNILTNILRIYDDKDPYTLIAIGNIYYDLAFQNRGKEDTTKNLSKSLEYYYQALEADKYNTHAAVGIANIFAEYNLTTNSLDLYKLVAEKSNMNHNALVNEAIIYMSEGKFEKSSIILSKLLKKYFKGKCPQIENLLAKAFMEMKDFDSAFKILTGLMLKYPDNFYFKFNYALCLKQKGEEILLRPERKVKETEEAIKNFEKAIPLFEALYYSRKEITTNFKNDREEKIFKSSEFFNKCSEILQFLHVTLNNSKGTLEKDKIREKEILNRIEENRIKYNRMLETMKELDEKEREEIKKKILEEEKLANSFKEKFTELVNSKKKYAEEAAKKKKSKEEKEEDKFISNEHVEDENLDNAREEKKRKKHEKHKKNKKRHRSEDNLDVDDAYVDPEEKFEKRKIKKLRKKQKTEDDEGDYFAGQQEENMYQGEADNLFREENENLQEENGEQNENNENNDKNEAILKDVEMKDYTKNENDEEVDFS